MRLLSKLFIVALVFATASLSVSTADAAMTIFNLFPFTGDPTQVQVTVDDTSMLGFITVTVDVIPTPNIGDIRAVFFNIKNKPVSLALTDITGADITDKAFDTIDLGGGNHLKPSPLGPPTDEAFDVGLAIGTPGIGMNDIQSTTFKIDDLDSIDVADFCAFGVRLTSVGTDSTRNGSSKLFSREPIPEPTTMMLLGTGIAGLIARRRAKRS